MILNSPLIHNIIMSIITTQDSLEACMGFVIEGKKRTSLFNLLIYFMLDAGLVTLCHDLRRVCNRRTLRNRAMTYRNNKYLLHNDVTSSPCVDAADLK